MYEEAPVRAAVHDAGHFVAEWIGLNAIDDFIADRKSGKNSPGELLGSTIEVGVASMGARRGGGPKTRAKLFIDPNVHPQTARHATEAIEDGIIPKG